MELKTERKTVGELTAGHHVCSTFRTDKERYDLIAPFVAAGLAGNERVAYFTDERSPQDVYDELAKRGIDVERYVKSSRLDVATTRQSYLAGGSFDPESVIDGLVKTVNRAIAQGLTGVRVAGDMGWIRRGIAGYTRYGEYERRIQAEIFTRYPVIGLCEFDLRHFSAAWLPVIHDLHPHGALSC